MATYIWDNIGAGNGLVPDVTKPLPESVLIYNQTCLALTYDEFNNKKRLLKLVFCIISVKIYLYDYSYISQQPRSK